MKFNLVVKRKTISLLLMLLLLPDVDDDDDDDHPRVREYETKSV
jgi:hypothetical protein